jgi:hypothetical protein
MLVFYFIKYFDAYNLIDTLKMLRKTFFKRKSFSFKYQLEINYTSKSTENFF